jgi:predicted DNA-binding protein
MDDLSRLLREEAEHAEQNKDAIPGVDARVSRPGRDRAKVLSIRLNAEEHERLVARAEQSGVGPSTIARSLILGALNEGNDQDLSDSWRESVSQRLSRLEAKIAAD